MARSQKGPRRGGGNRRYRKLEQAVTWALSAESILFLLYLGCNRFGATWLSTVLAVVMAAGAVLGLVYLYLTRELTRPRSRWMTGGFGAVLLCLALSSFLHFSVPEMPAPGGGPVAPAETQSAAWNIGWPLSQTEETAPQAEENTFIWNKDNDPDIKSGSLKVRLDGARIIEAPADLPGQFVMIDGAGGYDEGDGPDYQRIFNEGEGFLVVVDVTFENIDAVLITKDEVDAERKPFFADDPYTFDASYDLKLALLQFKRQGFYDNLYIGYTEDPLSFRIEPGEQISMTVGFVVENTHDGKTVDRTQLMLCDRPDEYGFIGLLKFDK